MRTNFSIARKAKIRSDIKEHEQRCAKQMLLEKTEVKTNADRIRAMSDEEMSVFLWEFDKEEIARATEYALERRKIIEWLKQPAE